MGRPFWRKRHRPSTPAGEHRPVMLAEVLEILNPQEGEIAVDCTCGFGGHSTALLQRLGPAGMLYAFDFDLENIELTRPRLEAVGHPFELIHGNFAGFPAVLNGEQADCLLADLGMSSMQVDQAERGFSFMRDGPLDMRMDRTRGRTAAEYLQEISLEELTGAIAEIGDEPQAATIAEAIVARRKGNPISRTKELAELILEAAPVRIVNDRKFGTERQQKFRPVARVFQTLRIAVNRELANLQELLRVLPWMLKPGGRAAIISFHSGEDRLVKHSFKVGHESGYFAKISEEPLRPAQEERFENPRSRSAKLRWAVRGEN